MEYSARKLHMIFFILGITLFATATISTYRHAMHSQDYFYGEAKLMHMITRMQKLQRKFTGRDAKFSVAASGLA